MIRRFKTKGILIIFRVFVPLRYGVFKYMSKLVIRDWFAINVFVLNIQDNKYHGTKRSLLETAFIENQE